MKTNGNVFEIFSGALYKNYEYYTFQVQQLAKVIKHLRGQQQLLNRCKSADTNFFFMGRQFQYFLLGGGEVVEYILAIF